MIRICTTLAQAGYEVILLGRQQKKSQPIQQQLFLQKRLTCFFQKGKWFYIEYNIRLFCYLLFQKVEVLYAVDLDTILPCFLVAKWRRKVIVYDAHEYFTQTPELVNRKLVQSIWKWIERFTVLKIPYCITVGDGLAQLFEHQYQKRFTVLRNMPFRTEVNSSALKHQPPVLLYQGALNAGRGLEEMIAAMPYLLEVELWIAGEGDLSSLLRQKVADLNLSQQVKFLGYITPENLKKLTPKVTIGLNLLENKGLSYYYSLANKVFDYVQAGVPCINMDFPEYRYLNTKYEVALLIPDLEITTLVNAVNELLQQPTYYQMLQQNCYLAAQYWHWEQEQKELIELFQRIKTENFLTL